MGVPRRYRRGALLIQEGETGDTLYIVRAGRLRAFQQINDIPVTGKLDNATLNRLFHLDFDAKNLKRAKRFKADALPK